MPALLDEVHWLIENRGLHFAHCGSSARKARRGAANLLGGRAVRFELRGLTAGELGDSFELDRILNHGYLPRSYVSSRPRRLLDAYIADYLREEILAEGLVRNLPAFSGFLEAAALSDGSFVNFSNVARECGVSVPTAKSHFQILEDTLVGRWLPAYRKRVKRRVVGAPKSYFADVRHRESTDEARNPRTRIAGLRQGIRELGVPRASPDTSTTGMLTWISRTGDYRAGSEVDFILGPMQVAIEAKATKNVVSHHFKGLRTLSEEHPGISQRIVVCLESRAWRTDDGISVLPASTFAQRLWQGNLLEVSGETAVGPGRASRWERLRISCTAADALQCSPFCGGLSRRRAGACWPPSPRRMPQPARAVP